MSSNATHHHILPLKLYLAVGGTLLFLTFVTWWTAHFDFGAMNMVIAMVIALIKATLVVMYFMHLKYDSKLYLSVFLLALLMLATFIIFTMLDTERRGEVDRITKDPIRMQAEFYDSLPKKGAHGDTTSAHTGDSTAAAPTTAPAGSGH